MSGLGPYREAAEREQVNEPPFNEGVSDVSDVELIINWEGSGGCLATTSMEFKGDEPKVPLDQINVFSYKSGASQYVHHESGVSKLKSFLDLSIERQYCWTDKGIVIPWHRVISMETRTVRKKEITVRWRYG
jgi:hypothetical protein